MLANIEVWQFAAGLVLAVLAGALVFVGAMSRFLKRPSPSEAIIRIGRSSTDVFIGRATWIVPILHRAATLSLSTIGLTIRRAGHDALVTKDFISTNLCAEFYIRVEPAEDDVKKAARTLGIDEGHASTEAIRRTGQELLEPKLVGALRAVAAQNDFLALHMNREHFAQEVSKALREDLGRNGFTLESVTITELAQTPLSDMRADDIFGASGRQTVTHTVVEKNIAVKRKVQEEAERTAEIAREQQINVATQDRIMREGKAREEEAAVKAEIAQKEAIEARDLQRQSFIAVEKAKKEKTEQSAEIDRQKAVEAARVDKEITLTLKATQSAEADAKKAAALALRMQANQQVITVEERIAAEIEAYKRKVRAQAEADAAEKQAQSITRLAEANREAGLKEAEVQQKKLAAANSKSRELLLQETAMKLLEVAPAIVKELVKPAERIGEIKVLQLSGAGGSAGNGTQNQVPLLGGALGPMMQTILQTSALMPALKEMMRFVDTEKVTAALERTVGAVDPQRITTPAAKAALENGTAVAQALPSRD